MKWKALSLMMQVAVWGVLVFALFRSSVAQQAPPAAGATQELPAGPGREPFLRICTGCHLASVATSERRTADSWSNVVDDMRARGANGSDEEMDAITAWLATNYPAKAVASNVNTTSH